MRKAYIVSVEMGYGHMRAARPLRKIAEGGEIVPADNYEGIPDHDRSVWQKSARVYYFFSRLSERGFFGNLIFRAFNYFQRIESADKKQVKPTLQLRQGYSFIKRGWGRDLIEKLNKKPLPFITTFFTIGQMAEVWDYKEEIYVLATDSDVSRVWAPLEPQRSRINYFAPTETVRRHLENYGVRPDKIYVTGFPLPPSLVGESSKIALQNFEKRYRRLNPKSGSREPIKITFAIGGAGAQSSIGRRIVKGLRPLLRENKVVFHIILGTHRKLLRQFKEEPGIQIFCCQTKNEYFDFFNKTIAETDVLWTKPSELSFYAGLGLPILMAPPLGAQEEKNREWLLGLGCGIDEGNPEEAYKWFPELLESGALARASKAGFEKIEKNAVEKIYKIVFDKKT